MANSIELFKAYVPLLDEVYKSASLTSVLDGAADLARQGVNANELVIPKMTMDGLADYSRSAGYVDGDVSISYETVACNYDRGRMFTVDTLDNEETAAIAYGQLSSEFIRTQVVPELDAFRLATYASADGISAASEDLSDGEGVISALRTATNTLDEAEVPEAERYLFITPTLIALTDDLDTTKSRAVLDRFAMIIRVPQPRFFSAITLGEGGFSKAEDAVNLNFLVIHKPAVIQYERHVAPKVITPDANQTSDGWKFGYRNVGIAEVYENKVSGIYASMANAATTE